MSAVNGAGRPRAWGWVLALVALALPAGPGALGSDPAIDYRMGRYAEAAATWRARAEAGDVEALYRLSQVEARGLGVARDPSAARAHLARAARGGHPRAAYDLAMTEDRPGGDTQALVFWTRIAADRGVPEAQYNLATMLEEGALAPRDLVGALVWYKLAAAALGSLAGNENLARVAARLNPAERAEAEARVRAFRPETPRP